MMGKSCFAHLKFFEKGGVILSQKAMTIMSTLAPDEKNLLGQFSGYLKEDKYAGKRETGQAVSRLADQLRIPRSYHVWCKGISAAKGEQQQKKIFSRLFSYLPEMWKSCAAEEPDNRKCSGLAERLKNYEELQQLILSENREITMGMQILSCEKEAYDTKDREAWGFWREFLSVFIGKEGY